VHARERERERRAGPWLPCTDASASRHPNCRTASKLPACPGLGSYPTTAMCVRVSGRALWVGGGCYCVCVYVCVRESERTEERGWVCFAYMRVRECTLFTFIYTVYTCKFTHVYTLLPAHTTTQEQVSQALQFNTSTSRRAPDTHTHTQTQTHAHTHSYTCVCTCTQAPDTAQSPPRHAL